MTPKNINPQQNNTADFTTEHGDNSTSLGQQWAKLNLNDNNRKPNQLEQKRSSQVLLEAYVEDEDLAELSTTTTTPTSSSFRTKSLTDEDLEELKGCVDLGFGFSYDEIPELCNTLPALELCYSMSQRFMDHELQRSSGGGGDDNGLSTESESDSSSLSSSPVANWKISSPGDHPEDVKARLKYWAQAVACTVKLCS